VNGTEWQLISGVADIWDSDWINGIAYGGGKYVIAGEGTTVAAWSANTTGWTAVVEPKITDVGLGVAYGEGSFVLVSKDGTASYSTDGIKWTLIADTKFEGSAINGVGYGNGKFVMVGGDGKIAYSTPE
jgi:hypothetical protein